MIGCCGQERHKFKKANGKVDKERLDVLCENIKAKTPNEDQTCEILSRVKQCSCPCHIDGRKALC